MHRRWIVQRILPTYRLETFRQLSKGLGFKIIFSKEAKGAKLRSITEAHRLNGMHYEQVQALYWIPKKETACLQNLIPSLWRDRPEIVLCEFGIAYLTFWLLLLLSKVMNFKLIAYTHGLNSKQSGGLFSRLGFQLRLFAFQRVDGILFYSKKRMQNTLKHFHTKPNQTFGFAPNTIELDTIRKHREATTRAKARKELGWSDSKKYFFYIGRDYPEKHLDWAIQALDRIQKENSFEFEFHLIGPVAEPVSAGGNMSAPRPWLFHHGEIYEHNVLANFFMGADLLLNPGVVGLSAVQALAYGLPVMSFAEQNHGPEYDYLENGLNSWILSPPNSNIKTPHKSKNQTPRQKEMYSDALAQGLIHWNNSPPLSRPIIIEHIETEASEQQFYLGFEKLLHDISDPTTKVPLS